MAYRRLSQASAVVLLLLSGLSAGAAQSVRGAVIDRSSTAPLPGVVVLLVDVSGNTVARALTNERGEFRLSASTDGTYRVHTLRIGFRPAMSDLIALRSGEEVTQLLSLAGIRVALDTVRVVGRNACRALGESGSATYAIWEQIRTALTATQLTTSAHLITVTTVTYDRMLDRNARRVRQQRSFVRSGLVTQPWRSVSPDSAHRVGYIIAGDDDSTTYYAPGLEVLLSDVFVADHCFRVATSSDTTRLGIAFEPTPDRKQVPEIRGTLWLDRQSSELRSMEFGYVNVTRVVRERSESAMEFVRLRNGSWAILRWNIRMPLLVIASGWFGAKELRVDGLKVSGGELALAAIGRDTLWKSPPLVLVGTVTDSLSRAAVWGARVVFEGTVLRAETDSTGRFAIPGVLPGEYTVQVRTEGLDSLNAVYQTDVLFADSTSTLQIRLPTAQQLAGALCGDARLLDPLSEEGMIVGMVDMRGDSIPPKNVRVVAQWTRRLASTVPEGAFAERQARWRDARATSRGAFRICGVPVNTALLLRATSDSASSAPLTISIAGNGRFARAELTLDPRVESGATFTGLVLTDSTQQPIGGAEVAIPELSRSVLTDARGAFWLSDIPAGAHEVVVRHLGYGALNAQLTFRANRRLERQILLTKAVTLDTVAVTASAVIPDFEEHRRLGLGQFITRAELEKQEGRRLSEVLAQVPGIRVIHGPANHAWVASSGPRSTSGNRVELEGIIGMTNGCYAQVYLDNVLVSKSQVPDINRFFLEQIEAIEYYAGPAQTPLKYSTLNSECGVVVIHTRRSR